MKRFFLACAAPLCAISLLAQSPASGSRNGHNFVDLGLPGGTKWATCNIGASTPGEGGEFFQWGFITPFPDSDLAQVEYKYAGQKLEDFAGNPKHDTAAALWGTGWRMPTKGDVEELLDNCEWVFVADGDGLPGYEITGPNGKSIFLPCAGTKFAMGLYDEGEAGGLWTASPYGADLEAAFALGFGDPWDSESGEEIEDGVYDIYGGDRAVGLSIRPVCK